LPYKGEQRVIRCVSGGPGAFLGAWTVGGGAPNAASAVSDDVDTTYVLGPTKDQANSGSIIKFSLVDPTLASNERIVQYRPRVKAKVNDSGGSTRRSGFWWQIGRYGSLVGHPANYAQYIPTSPTKEYPGTWRTRDVAGKEVSLQNLIFTTVKITDNTPNSFTSGQRIRITEVFLDYIVNRRPTLSGLTITDHTTTTSPLLSYTWNDLDGDVQLRHQIKVFTEAQALIPGFNVDTSTPVYDSGAVTTSDAEHRILSNLTNGINYRVYVRASQSLGDLGEWWSAWSFTNFTIALTAPPSPDLTLVGYESAFDRVTLLLRGRANDLTDEDSSFEGATLGNWASTSGDTLTNSNAWAASGTRSLQLQSVGPGAMEAGTAFFSASAGRVYWARATVRSAATVRTATVILRFYNAAFGQIGGDFTSPGVATSTSIDKDLVLQDATAPAGTRWRRIFVNFNDSATSEIQRFDKTGTGPGAGTPPTWHIGGLTQPGSTGYEMQYADMTREGNIVHPNIASGGGYFESPEGWYPRNATDVIEISNEVPPYQGDWCIRWVPMTTGSVLDVGSRQNNVDPYIWAVKPGQVYEHSVRVRPYSGTFTVIVRFVYVDAAGAVVNSVQTTLAATTAWTEFVPADSTAGAGAVFCRMEVENSSGGIEIPVFLDDVQFGEFGHRLDQTDPGQGTALTWQPWRRSVDFETGDLSALVLAQDLVAAQEASLFDHEVPPNKLRVYRARAVSLIASQDVASSWSAILPVSISLAGNWLKYPHEPALNFQPAINGLEPMQRNRSLRRGVHEVVGRSTPVVITGRPSSESFDLELVVQKQSDWHKLYAMALSDGPLLLRTPGRQWWVQAVGEPKEIDYTVRQKGESYYKAAQVSFVEVATP
jgi:hypothetical protein